MPTMQQMDPFAFNTGMGMVAPGGGGPPPNPAGVMQSIAPFAFNSGTGLGMGPRNQVGSLGGMRPGMVGIPPSYGGYGNPNSMLMQLLLQGMMRQGGPRGPQGMPTSVGSSGPGGLPMPNRMPGMAPQAP